MGNDSLTPTCSLSKRSLSPSLPVVVPYGNVYKGWPIYVFANFGDSAYWLMSDCYVHIVLFFLKSGLFKIKPKKCEFW